MFDYLVLFVSGAVGATLLFIAGATGLAVGVLLIMAASALLMAADNPSVRRRLCSWRRSRVRLVAEGRLDGAIKLELPKRFFGPGTRPVTYVFFEDGQHRSIDRHIDVPYAPGTHIRIWQDGKDFRVESSDLE